MYKLFLIATSIYGHIHLTSVLKLRFFETLIRCMAYYMLDLYTLDSL